MNHREPPQVPQGMRRAGQLRVLLLAVAGPGIDSFAAHADTLLAHPCTEASGQPGGYLPSLGAPPLRFAPVVVPASPATQITPPVPSNSTTPVKAPVGDSTRTANPPASPASPSRPSIEAAASTSPAEKPAPLSILPDDAPSTPKVAPEDFLPFFQIPGSRQNPDVTIVAPIPPQPPSAPPQQPSSATYLQTEK